MVSGVDNRGRQKHNILVAHSLRYMKIDEVRFQCLGEAPAA